MKETGKDRHQKHSLWSLEPEGRAFADFCIISSSYQLCLLETLHVRDHLFGDQCDQVHISLFSVSFPKSRTITLIILKEISHFCFFGIYYLEFLNFRAYTLFGAILLNISAIFSLVSTVLFFPLFPEISFVFIFSSMWSGSPSIYGGGRVNSY